MAQCKLLLNSNNKKKGSGQPSTFMDQIMIGLNGSLIYKIFVEIIFVVRNSPPPINYPSKFMWDVKSFREKNTSFY